MTLDDGALLELTEVAVAAALKAGAHIRASRPTRVERKPGATSAASAVVTEVDRAAEALIVDALEPTCEARGLALLTEERPDDGRRLGAPAFWCVDPLDGTLPFVEGEPGYAVSIGLVSRAGAPLVGVVYRPVEGRLYRAARGQGATVDGTALVAREAGGRLTVFGDHGQTTHPFRDALLARFDRAAAALDLDGVDLVEGAGGVTNHCLTLERGPACTLKTPKDTPGGGSLWDYAATACIAREAGGVATDASGDPLELNRATSTFMNHRGILYASSARVADAVRRASDTSAR